MLRFSHQGDLCSEKDEFEFELVFSRGDRTQVTVNVLGSDQTAAGSPSDLDCGS